MPVEPTEDEERLRDCYVIHAATPEEMQATLVRVVTARMPQRFGLHPIQDMQVLTPMNRGSLGPRALNARLQEALNPDRRPGSHGVAGPAVMCAMVDQPGKAGRPSSDIAPTQC